MDPELAILELLPLFYSAERQFRQLGQRLGEASWHKGEAILRAEADNWVRNEIAAVSSSGGFNFELANFHYEGLLETESHLWGLAIVGLFHLWERDTRGILRILLNKDESKMEKFYLKQICDGVKATGYDVTASNDWCTIKRARLITNTIKHGDGDSARDLLLFSPELFPAGNKAKDLRVGKLQFNETVSTFVAFWRSYAMAYFQKRSKELL